MNPLGQYILVGQTAVPEPDLTIWAAWFESADRVVFQDEVPGGWLSTVFLGLDHNHARVGPPILFETMLFMDSNSADCKRCSTWLEAEAQHKAMLAKCLEKKKNNETPHVKTDR